MKEISLIKITIEDKEQIELFLPKYSTFCISSFTFSSPISRERVYHYQWAIVNDTLLLKLITSEYHKEHLMQPVDEFHKSLKNKIIQFTQALVYKLTNYDVSNASISPHPEFFAHFESTENRDVDNYICSAEDLAFLKGKEYQPKRNLINQFEKNNNWTSESDSEANINECFKVIDKICSPKEVDPNRYLVHELKTLEFILRHISQFKEEGVLIRVDGKPVVFSKYEHLNPSTCVVHIEKAILDYKDLYQIVNRERTKKIFKKDCKNINREEDLGIEGLRKAKLSYHLLKLCPAHTLFFTK